MAAGEALGGLIGGILGNNAAKMDRRNQKKLMKQMVEEYKKIGYPPDYAREIIMQELVRQGQYTPELEEDLSDSVAESAMEDIKPNEALSKEQMASIQGIKMLSKTGLGAEDRAAYNEMRSRLRQDEQASTAALLNKLQAQGMGGSGAALMAALGNSQQAANLASQEADSLMANASSARRNALTELGRAAGDMQQQEFNREAQIATAMDERNRFLAENSIARQQRNVQSLNQAQQLNRAEQQRISDYNIQQKNAELLRQRQAEQAQYTDKLNYAAGITGQQKQLANYYGAAGDAKAQAQMNMAKGVGGMVDSGYNAVMGSPGTTTTGVNAQGQSYSQTTGAQKGMFDSGGGMAGIAAMFSDKNLKTDIEYSDEDVQKWMDSLSERIIKKKI